MAVNVEELVVKFTADIGGLKTNLERVEKSFKSVDKTVAATSGKMSSQIAGLGRLFKLDLAIRYGRQLLTLEDQMEQLASTIKDTSDRADIGAEALQRLRHVADQNGTSAEALDSALIRLNKAMGLARLGAEGMGELFQALGLEELIKKGASTEEVFLGIADAVRGMKDETQASAVVAKIMGREADRLIETFKLGGAEAKRVGEALKGVISQETIDKLDAARDRTEEYKKTINALGSAASTVFVDIVLFLGNIGKELEKNFGLATQIIALYDSVANFGSGNLAQSFGAAPSRGDINEKAHAAAKHKSLVGQSFTPIRDTTDSNRLKTLLGDGTADGGSKGIDKAAQAAERYSDAVADLMFDIQQLTRSEQEAAFQEELRNRLSAAGVTAASEQGKAIEELVSQLTSQTRAGEELAASWAVEAANANRAIAEMHAEMMAAAEAWQDFTDSAGDAVADAFGRAILEGEGLREVIAGLLEDLARLIFQKLVFDQISSAVSSGIGGIVGGFASGGGISPGNTYMVGERGPELFVPKVPGNIVPNGGGRGGGGGIVFNQVLNAQGANPATVATLKQMLAQSKDEILRAVPKLMIDKQRRNSLQGAF